MFFIILCAVPSYVTEDAAVDDAVDNTLQEIVYYYGDNSYYVSETNNTDDEYVFTPTKSKTRTNISQTRTKGSY